MHVRPNPLKARLRDGGIAFGTSVRLPEPGLCEILGYAGFDFVLIDGEHGSIDAAALDRLVMGCLAGGTLPFHRVLRKDDPAAIGHALDLGAQGILIPHCCSAADALALREAALFPPAGHRGFGPGRGACWGRVPNDEFLTTANDAVLLLALIEDPEAIEQIDEIAAAGLDVLWIGTGDLALSYGVRDPDHPRVREAAERMAAACQKHGVAAGFPVRKLEDIAWARERGFRVLGFGGAEQYVMQQGRQWLERARS